MQTFVVTTRRLNLRSAPQVAPDNVLATLTFGEEVVAIESSAKKGWRKVRARANGQSIDGYSASRFLHRRRVTATPAPPSASIMAVHLPLHPGARRDSRVARAMPLSDAIPQRVLSASHADKASALHAIVNALDVERSARYQPNEKHTYCNIYAYDVIHAAGVYLPRVWWTKSALEKLQNGSGTLSVAYGSTVHELNANALHIWLTTWGEGFGWTRSQDLDDVQRRVNDGAVAVVCGRRTDPKRSGHITCVLPEANGHTATRQSGKVVGLLQSQAGTYNHRLFSDAWWISRRTQFADVGFWWSE